MKHKIFHINNFIIFDFTYQQLIHLGGDFVSEIDKNVAKLTIRQVYPEDEGEYTCTAYNDLGKAVTSACLIVDGK